LEKKKGRNKKQSRNGELPQRKGGPEIPGKRALKSAALLCFDTRGGIHVELVGGGKLENSRNVVGSGDSRQKIKVAGKLLTISFGPQNPRITEKAKPKSWKDVWTR